MTYLIAGLDRSTLDPWHVNVHVNDVATATRLALTRAAACGVTLVVAGVIGPGSTVIPDATEPPATAEAA